MNNKTTFYLARHGQTEWNVEHRIQGQLDSPLTIEGKAQALQLAEQCRTLNITQILTSPLARAVDTAIICGQQLQLTPKQVHGFEERHFGVWQGRLVSEVKAELNYVEITSQITDCKPELGESAKELLARFETTLKKQLQVASNETYLIVTHGDILRSFMAKFNTKIFLEPKKSTGYDYKNAQLVPFSYDQTTTTFSKL